jgi:hypothetical protein
MKNSLSLKGTRNVFLRLARLVFPAIVACSLATSCRPQGMQAPQAAPASQSSFIGQWRTTTSIGTITITFMANGQYNQVGVTTRGVQEAQDGPYQLEAPNTIIFRVTDWSPKSTMVLVPCGIPDQPTCNTQRVQNNPKPPDSSYTYSFNGTKSMQLKNQVSAFTFTRVVTP